MGRGILGDVIGPMRTLKAGPLITLCNLIYKSIMDVIVVTLRKCGLGWLFTERFIVTLNYIKPGTPFASLN